MLSKSAQITQDQLMMTDLIELLHRDPISLEEKMFFDFHLH